MGKRRCLLRNFLWHKWTENLMITTTNVTLVLYEWDTNLRKVRRKISKFTDLTKLVRIIFAHINCGAPLAGSDNVKWLGDITGTNVMLVRGVISKRPKFMTLQKVDHIDSKSPLHFFSGLLFVCTSCCSSDPLSTKRHGHCITRKIHMHTVHQPSSSSLFQPYSSTSHVPNLHES